MNPQLYGLIPQAWTLRQSSKGQKVGVWRGGSSDLIWRAKPNFLDPALFGKENLPTANGKVFPSVRIEKETISSIGKRVSKSKQQEQVSPACYTRAPSRERFSSFKIVTHAKKDPNDPQPKLAFAASKHRDNPHDPFNQTQTSNKTLKQTSAGRSLREASERTPETLHRTPEGPGKIPKAFCKTPVATQKTPEGAEKTPEVPQKTPELPKEIPAKPSPLKFQGEYSVGEPLGKGSYATVYLGTDPDSNEKCAVKVYDKKTLQSVTRKEIVRNEIRVLRLLSHPNVLKLFRVRENGSELHLLTELVEGESLNALAKRYPTRAIPEEIARPIARKLLSGLRYLHSLGLFHRDLKLENVLVSEAGEPKIVDFGFAIQASQGDLLTLFCGTPNYMAPELVQRRPYLGGPSDCWAFGVLLFRMLTGYFPFASRKQEGLTKKILALDFHCPESMSHDARKVVQNLLMMAPEDRATCEQLAKFKFFLP